MKRVPQNENASGEPKLAVVMKQDLMAKRQKWLMIVHKGWEGVLTAFVVHVI